MKRENLIFDILTEILRYWAVCSLLYFLARGAQLAWLQRLLEAYIIGMPIMLVLAFAAIFAWALYVYWLNHQAWHMPNYPYALEVDLARRRQRLSLTDIQLEEIHAWNDEVERLKRLS